MKIKAVVAKVIAKASVNMAKKAYGTASLFGTYQPKEPKILAKIVK